MNRIAAVDIEKKLIEVEGQTWNIATTGPKDAERTLLICNGIGASVDTINPFVEHFKRTRIVAFDVPGVGESPTPLLPYRFFNLSWMLNRILDQEGIGKVDVFGVSWGGALAQQFAYDNQRRCRSLTLAATTAGAVMVPGSISVLRKLATPRRYRDPDYMMEVGAEIYGGELEFNRELLKDHAMAMKGGDRRGYAYQLLAAAGWTSFLWLPRIKLPTLIIYGKDDPIVPPVNAKFLAWRLPNAVVVQVDCGHMFVLTQAEAIADRVEQFIHTNPSTLSEFSGVAAR